jgi:hypothetical protein
MWAYLMLLDRKTFEPTGRYSGQKQVRSPVASFCVTHDTAVDDAIVEALIIPNEFIERES